MADPLKYTVGWIAALEIERVAAECMLDEEHERLLFQAKGDLNDYTLGKIGTHNVVIASLPGGRSGTRNAAAVARDMARTFADLRFALMVGIGGGAPTEKNDIRLGDVVVAAPSGRNHEIVNFTCGKLLQDQGFQCISSQTNTPPLLANAVAGMNALYSRKGHNLQSIITDSLVLNPKARRRFRKPSVKEDILYASEYRHKKEGQPCTSSCDRNPESVYIVRRQSVSLQDPEDIREDPTIHCGPIGSTDVLMKSATERDTQAQVNGVLCFETESAGLLQHFPCLPIRGISDYSDTHKNDDWHGYAAITAAAYAKALLLRVLPSQVEAEKCAVELLQNINEHVSEVHSKVSSLDRERQFREAQEQLSTVAPLEFSSKYQHCIQEQHSGSGTWFLKSARFQTFLKKRGCALLCLGIPGAGKSFMSAIAIKHLKTAQITGRTFVVTYLFCDYKSRTQHSAEGMLSILLGQLLDQSPDKQSGNRIWQECKRSGTRGSVVDLTGYLIEILRSFAATTRVCAILDGLDECRRDGTVKDMMESLFAVQKKTGLRILATSRPLNEVTNIFEEHDYLRLDICAQKEDLESYVQSQIARSPSLDWLLKQRKLWNNVKSSLVQTAGGMFLIAKLYVSSLQGCNNTQDVLQFLENVRSHKGDVDAAYETTFDRIKAQSGSGHRIALHALLWVTFGARPLRTTGLEQAVAIHALTTSFDRNGITNYKRILSLCQGLLETREPQKRLSKRGEAYWGTLGFSNNHEFGLDYSNEWGIVENLAWDNRKQERKDRDDQLPFVSLVHETAQGYLESALSRYFAKEFASPHLRLSELCLTHLLHSDFATPERGFSFDTLDSDQRDLPFYYRYVIKEWAGHCYQASCEPRELLLRFLNSQCHIDSAFRSDWYERNMDIRKKLSGPNGLFVAARHGLVPVISDLCGKGQDPNQVHHIWSTPLIEAVESTRISSTSTRVETVAALIQAGAIVDQRWYGLTAAITRACEVRNIQVLNLLLQHGSDLQGPTTSGQTPLIYAIKGGDEELVNVLLSHGASLSKVFNLGSSPLAAAIDYAQYGKIGNGRGISAIDTDPNEAPGCGTSILATLFKRGADPNEEDELGFLPLSYLIRRSLEDYEFHPERLGGQRKLEICEMLVASGANVDLSETRGNNLIHGRCESPLEYLRRKLMLCGTLKLPSGLASKEEFQLYLKALLHKSEMTTQELNMLGLESQSGEQIILDSNATESMQDQWRLMASREEVSQSRKRASSNSASVEYMRYWLAHSRPRRIFFTLWLRDLKELSDGDSGDEAQLDLE